MSDILLVNANSLQIPLADKSVHCVVTSPPYWGLRDYGIEGQLGLEQTLEGYVESMVQVFREVWRVLRDDGTLWLNLGDTYASGMRSAYDDDRHKYQTARAHDKRPPTPNGIKPKDLIGIPWRVAFALQADGWYLRSDIVWHKPNPMPESVTDRPTKAHEYLFLLSKSASYFYDADAIRERRVSDGDEQVAGWVVDGEHTAIAHTQPKDGKQKLRPSKAYSFSRASKEPERPGQNYGNHRSDRDDVQYSGSRNKRTVWTIATAPYSGAHFATYPPALVEPCIKAGTSEAGCCSVCGAQWVRVTERQDNRYWTERRSARKKWDFGEAHGRNDCGGSFLGLDTITAGFQPSCKCNAPTKPATVLDPFAGSGTTLQVARQLGRNAIGLDLSYTYLHDQARARLELDKLDAWTNGRQAEETPDLGPLFGGAA